MLCGPWLPPFRIVNISDLFLAVWNLDFIRDLSLPGCWRSKPGILNIYVQRCRRNMHARAVYSLLSCLRVVLAPFTASRGPKFLAKLCLINRLPLLEYVLRLRRYGFGLRFHLWHWNVVRRMLKLLIEREFFFILIKFSLNLCIFCKLASCCTEESLLEICRPILCNPWICCRSLLVWLRSFSWLRSWLFSRFWRETDCSMLG